MGEILLASVVEQQSVVMSLDLSKAKSPKAKTKANTTNTIQNCH